MENWTVWELYNKSGAIAVATKNKWGSTSNNLLAMFHTLPVIKASANMSHSPAHMLLTPGFVIPVILETGEAEENRSRIAIFPGIIGEIRWLIVLREGSNQCGKNMLPI